jgi:hypothetical protein
MEKIPFPDKSWVLLFSRTFVDVICEVRNKKKKKTFVDVGRVCMIKAQKLKTVNGCAGYGVRTHAHLCAEDLKSSPLTSRANQPLEHSASRYLYS